jgi:hypothetical protein
VNKLVVGALLLGILWIAIPTQATASVEWQVTWYHMDDPGVFDLEQRIAETSFPFRLSFDWGDDIVLSRSELLASSRWNNRWNKIGFQATCQFYVSDSGLFSFSISANNGFILWIDEREILRSWEVLLPDGTEERSMSVSTDVNSGLHELVLWYYEWDIAACISFETSLDPLGFAQVAHLLDDTLAQRASIAGQLEETQALLEESRAYITQLLLDLDACSQQLINE